LIARNDQLGDLHHLCFQFYEASREARLAFFWRSFYIKLARREEREVLAEFPET
jgi:hypothetical protein